MYRHTARKPLATLAALTLPALGATLFLSACAADETDEVTGTVQAFPEYQEALPDRDALTLRLAGDDGAAGDAGGGAASTPEDGVFSVAAALKLDDKAPTAVYWQLSRLATWQVNGLVWIVLKLVETIATSPPTIAEPDQHVWGPWKDSGLSPVEWRFTMTKPEERHFEYKLEARPKDGDDESWVAIFDGSLERISDVARRGKGQLHIDFSAHRNLDPAQTTEGELDIVYDTVTDDNRDLTVEFIKFWDHNDKNAEEPVDATYHYAETADLDGEFSFIALQDVHKGSPDGAQYPLKENWQILTRWHGNGEGRADMLVTDGDLPGAGVDKATISECWGKDFKRDFYEETYFLATRADNIPAKSQGEAEDCAFEAADILTDGGAQ